ncbi:uncharacterized protein LOC142338596 [Convolutriloba macropyga]|uniref:uncharacterized protein LOC142338596 n=1 Tax=Convolutriloba macropyga TaxID=536237 RepID=UPI003F51AFC0
MVRPVHEAIRRCNGSQKDKNYLYTVYGMGATNFNEESPVFPDVLLYARMEEAVRYLVNCGKQPNRIFDRSTQICLRGWDPANNVDISRDDIGGPAVLRTSLDDCLYGIASKMADSLDHRTQGSIFTRVSYFENWISDAEQTLRTIQQI